MGDVLAETTNLWETISNFTPNEGIEINPGQIWQTFLSNIPRGGKLLKVFICDPHVSTCNQQGSLFLFYKEIYKIWDKRTDTKFMFATGRKRDKEMQPTSLWEEGWKNPWRPVRTDDIYRKMFRLALENKLYLDVRPLAMMSEIYPEIERDRTRHQHDRFIIFLMIENGVEILYKLTLSYGMDLYKCFCQNSNCWNGSHPQILTLFDEGAQVNMQRYDVTLSKFRHAEPRRYYDDLVNLTLINVTGPINEFHQEALSDEKENSF